MWIRVLIAAILGGFFDRYRGGMFSNRDEIVGRIKPEWLRKTVHFIVQGDFINALAFGLFCVFLVPNNYNPYLLFFWQFAMMWRWAAPSWGEYIGAAKGTQTTDFTSVYYIDKIIEPFRNRPRLWGVLGLSLRCGEWGLAIGAPFLNPFPAIGGLLAGPIVYGLSKVSFVPDKQVWPIFEIILGMLFWGLLLF